MIIGQSMANTIQFRGNCMGVKLRERGPNDPHITVILEVEDDENWYEQCDFSSYWLDELIEKLQQAKKFCESQEPDNYENHQYGWKFSNE
jgi:hypothetical protein